MNFSATSRLLSASAIGAALMASPQTVHAQSSPQSEDSGLTSTRATPQDGPSLSTDIVVTASRLNGQVQRLPIAVTVVNDVLMKELNLTHGEDFLKVVPALSTNLFVISGNNGTGTYMRGLPGVTAYFADAPSTVGNPGQFFDVESVQVLKGPQGTLFGGTASAGAFIAQPRRPGDTFEGYAIGTAGSYGRRNLEAAITIPLIGDTLTVRLGGRTAHRNGFVRDINTDLDYFDENYYLLRGSVIFKPSELFENYTMIQYYKMKQHGQVWKIVDYNPLPTPPTNILYRIYGAALDAAVARNLPGGDLGLYRVDNPNPNHGWRDEDLFIVNKSTLNFSDALIVENIFSFRRNGNRAQSNIDYDGTPLQTIILTQDPRQYDHPIPQSEVWANETLLRGRLLGGRLNYVLGAFFTGPFDTKSYVNFSSTFGATSATRVRNKSRSQAVFGNITMDLSDSLLEGLKIGAGYRRTWQQLSSTSEGFVYLPPPIPAEDLPSSRAPRTADAKFSDDSWTANLQYQANDDTLLYFTVSRGLDAGAVNPSAPDGLQTVKPEVLTQAELGVKATFEVGGVQFRTNIAGYYGTFDNIQAFTSALVQVNPPPAPPVYLAVTQNVAKARVKGIDAEIDIKPAPNLLTSFSAVYNGNKYLDFVVVDGAGNPTNLTGTAAFNGAPKFKYVARIAYTLPDTLFNPDWGELTLAFSYNHSSTQFYGGATVTRDRGTRIQSVANGYGPATVAAGGGNRLANVHMWPSYGEGALNLTWDKPLGSKNVQARFSILNLFNNDFGGIATGDNAIGGTFQIPAPPRMWQLDLEVRF